MFVENGHNKHLLKNLAIECSSKKNNNSNHESHTQNRDHTNLKKLSWIPNISLRIKCEFKKHYLHITFTLGKYLQQILCQNNKPKLLPNSQAREYQ